MLMILELDTYSVTFAQKYLFINNIFTASDMFIIGIVIDTNNPYHWKCFGMN